MPGSKPWFCVDWLRDRASDPAPQHLGSFACEMGARTSSKEQRCQTQEASQLQPERGQPLGVLTPSLGRVQVAQKWRQMPQQRSLEAHSHWPAWRCAPQVTPGESPERVGPPDPLPAQTPWWTGRRFLPGTVPAPGSRTGGPLWFEPRAGCPHAPLPVPRQACKAAVTCPFSQRAKCVAESRRLTPTLGAASLAGAWTVLSQGASFLPSLGYLEDCN